LPTGDGFAADGLGAGAGDVPGWPNTGAAMTPIVIMPLTVQSRVRIDNLREDNVVCNLSDFLN
jgi:hypothetical protein